MSIEKRLAELRALADKAIGGPWYIEDSRVRHDYDPFNAYADCSIEVCDVSRISEKLDHKKPTREFIATSRTAIPQLIDALEVMREALAFIGKDKDCFHTRDLHADIAARALIKSEEILK